MTDDRFSEQIPDAYEDLNGILVWARAHLSDPYVEITPCDCDIFPYSHWEWWVEINDGVPKMPDGLPRTLWEEGDVAGTRTEATWAAWRSIRRWMVLEEIEVHEEAIMFHEQAKEMIQ